MARIDMRNFREEDDDDEDEDFGPKPALFTSMTPDTMYTPESQSVTFIYSPQLNKFWYDYYPTKHFEMLDRDVGKEINPRDPPADREEAIANGALLGRAGKYRGATVIAFWAKPNQEDVKKCIQSFAAKLPGYVKYPDRTLVVSQASVAWYPITLSKFMPDIKNFTGTKVTDDGKKQMSQDTDAACKEIGVMVNGRFMPITELAGNLHMVKGPTLDLMKSAFCASYPDLKKHAEKLGCPGSNELIDHIYSRINCRAAGTSPQAQYNNLKKSGSSAYRSELQKTFSAPHTIDSEFRGRQKDIDAAWDYLQKGRRNESFAGFKNWLMSEGKKDEKQRRGSSRSSKKSHLFDYI
jgi:hypothetical protein